MCLQIDTSDKDGGVHMVNYPGVFGLGQPDTIKLFAHGGEDYVVSGVSPNPP
jgi:hypothetical protein